MQLSLVGLAVGLMLVGIDRALRGRLIIALFGSLVLGSTAVATLPSFGGSSPLVSAFVAAAMIAAVVLRRDLFPALGETLRADRASVLVLLLAVYTVAGAYLLPRLFEGATLVFASLGRTDKGGFIAAGPLSPRSTNLSQALYFAVGAATFVALRMILREREARERLRLAALLWAGLVAATGVLDITGKLLGLGDVMLPLRTASYVLLTGEDTLVANFPRISGAFPEASAYASVLVPSLAFMFAYWRIARGAGAFLLLLVLAVLLVFSTSTTAYASAAIAGLYVLAKGSVAGLVRGRLRGVDLLCVMLGLAIAAAMIGIAVYDMRIFAPLERLLGTALINKGISHSAIERSAWNAQAMQGLLDTHLIGVGIGSTRASSWVVAVISQLGVLGALLMGALVAMVWNGRGTPTGNAVERRAAATAAGCRSGALATLLAAAIAAPSADPGLIFFVLLAGALAVPHGARRHERAAGVSRSGPVAAGQAA